jgi:high-affinity iron transporter
VFFVVFRESLEVVSVLFAFLTQTISGPDKDPIIYRKLCKQVWLGVGTGLFICLAIGAGMIGAFYGSGVDDYSNTEDYWKGPSRSSRVLSLLF